MPKRYEFYSKLSPEDVFARLALCARPGGAPYSGDGTFRYRQEPDCFWLVYTGKWPVTGAIPFFASVKKADGGSRISGGFFLWRSLWKGFLLVGVAAFILMQFTGAPAAVELTMIVLWLLVSAGLISGANAFFLRERQRAVLDFVQKNLLE